MVYDSILSERRRKLHELIGNAIRRLHESNIDEFCEILADHFILSGNYERGAEYSKLSRRKTLKKGSPYDAIKYGEKLVDCLEKLPRTNEVEEKLISARTVLGLTYLQINYHLEAKETVAPIIDLASQHDSKIRLCQIYVITGAYKYLVDEDFPGGFEDLEKALDIANNQNNIGLFALVNFWLGLAHSLSTEFEKALDCYTNALRISEAANIPWSTSVFKSNISYFVHYFQGELNKAYELSKEAIMLAEEAGDIYSSGQAHISYGISCSSKGLFKEGREHLLKGIEFCERSNHIAWNHIAHISLGDFYFEKGSYENSKKYFEKTIELLEQNQIASSSSDVCRIGALGATVMKDVTDSNLKSLFSYAHKNKFRIHEGWMPRYIAQILLNIDDEHLYEAEGWVKKAIEADADNGMNFNLGRGYALYAELFKRKGDLSNAKENLKKAIEIFKQCGADGWVNSCEEELASLS